MGFKDWLNLREVGTGTNAVAVFSRPLGGGDQKMVRKEPLMLTFDGDAKTAKKKKNLA
jgi:hypothetical protein